MKKLILLLLFFIIQSSAQSQCGVSLDSWSLTMDNGDGTCDYSVDVTVSSGNGAAGTANFYVGAISGSPVHTATACTCNPTTITFTITVSCGATVNIFVDYDAPGGGNDCQGSTGDNVLPVEWINFEVAMNGSSNLLNWTVEEKYSLKYVIERLKNGIHFEQIGEIIGEGLSSLANYTYKDENPNAGRNYYRVKQVEYDNSFSYSEIVVVNNTILREISIYPNPFSDIISIKGDNMETWRLLDLYGRTIMIGVDDEINTKLLTQGMYYLHILENDRIIQVEPLIKF